ncbi:MAG TPA: DUF427 domain-containing protein [Solirubrobacteraceae bacterium]|jgi:uncharacterized protein (DUF427 family)
MGLMYGTGPFSRTSAGAFNFEPPPAGSVIYLEPTPRRIRVIVGDETVADSRRAYLLHESGLQPTYYFPPEDVRSDLLEPTDRHTRCPKKGEASYYSIRAGDRVVKNGAWYYPEVLPSAPPALRGLVAFYFDRIDRWMEEAEEIGVHARDPYHRVDVLASDRRVRVLLDGQLLADTRQALALFETGLPARWYIPAEDVMAELQPSDTATHCPYKGQASYHSVRLPEGRLEKDLVWYYEKALPEVGRIAGRLCFFNEKVDLELDGETQECPETAWSRR